MRSEWHKYTQEEKDGFKKHLIKSAEKTIPHRINEQKNSLLILQGKTKTPTELVNQQMKDRIERINKMHKAIEYLNTQIIPKFDSLSDQEMALYFSFFHRYSGKEEPEYVVN